jgi:glyoxylase-like metal-dependent hydrolase (beta-lactamase superfamily II)
MFTQDEQQAIESLAKVKKLKFETACFGHGPCIVGGADARVHAFIDGLLQSQR